MLSDLPPRAYVVRVWHPQLEGTEEATRKNVVSSARRADVAWTLNLKPEVIAKRPPAGQAAARIDRGNGDRHHSRESIQPRLPLHARERIKAAANVRDVPYQSLIKMWLEEKLSACQLPHSPRTTTPCNKAK